MLLFSFLRQKISEVGCGIYTTDKDKNSCKGSFSPLLRFYLELAQ